MPNSRIQREQPATPGRPSEGPQASAHATVVQLAELTRRVAPDRTGDSAQKRVASQAQQSVTNLVFLGAKSLEIAPRYFVHRVCREANPVSSQTPKRRTKRSTEPATIRPTYRHRQDLPPFRSTVK